MSKAPLAGFARLNDRVSLYRPMKHDTLGASRSPSTPQQPDLIVLCSWVGAAAKHIDKYTATHQRLYPDTAILLVQSRMLDLFIRHPNLDPAHEIMASFILSKDSRTNETSPIYPSDNSSNSAAVVLHAFSNGGARTGSLLATAFAAQHARCPFTTMILDCCPGKPELESVTRAITLPLPRKFFIRTMGWYVVYCVVALFIVYLRLTGTEDSASLFRRKLNDPDVVGRGVPRLYLYSERDEMISAGAVREHAAEARGAGYTVVREEVFATAPHCALVSEDGERYWGALREVVEIGAKT